MEALKKEAMLHQNRSLQMMKGTLNNTSLP